MANYEVKKTECRSRIELVLKESKLPSINALARELRLNRSENLYHITRGHSGISNDLANRICTKYPQFSRSWMLTGEGDPDTEPDTSQITPVSLQLDMNQARSLMSQLEYWLKINNAE